MKLTVCYRRGACDRVTKASVESKSDLNSKYLATVLMFLYNLDKTLINEVMIHFGAFGAILPPLAHKMAPKKAFLELFCTIFEWL